MVQTHLIRNTSLDACNQDLESGKQELLHLPLPGLLPESQLLVVHTKIRVISLVHFDTSTARICSQVQFSSYGMAVLFPVLLSYPNYCPYEVMVSRLFPLPVERCREMIQQAQVSERELLLRPLRRAVTSLVPGLYRLGLETCSIRNVGYLVKASLR